MSALVALSLLSAGAVSAADDKPGVGRNPAFICFKTTLTDQGHTRQSEIIRRSGNPMSDRGATRLVRSLKIMDTKGVPHVERDAFILVKMYGTGFAFRFFELHEPLPDICSAPPWERKRKG